MVEFLVFDSSCRTERKETFQTHSYKEVFKGFVFFKWCPLLPQYQGTFLHPLEKKVVSPVQACNNHLCCERSLLMYQTVRADFCLASAYCLLLHVITKEDKSHCHS